MSSSLLKRTRCLNALHPKVAFHDSLKLKAVIVDDMMLTLERQKRLPLEKLDTLLMDVQGVEQPVLKGAEDPREIKHVYCEVGCGGLCDNDMALEDFQQLMMDSGFSMYFLLIGRKGCGYALFVREEHIIKI